ncbi:MAG: polyphosphate polymerase domain-containing protein [Treponema sp.]|nr:polyphosphate polymerase domain-containing protein [Spirochaetia bacterium]MDD7459781.1 polyphosphate polymerase domain-containing protein [Spirochaetales bacterium]MDY5812135.1 polyphosphate polymerase domain-containing protein [Treponema sp.]MEE1180811.1 polyphosphate polymerase domain-containing protein [Treponema sp.]
MFRHEFKYISPESILTLIQSRVKVILQADSHAVNGIYAIRSLYFDDMYSSCYKENEDGTDPREKFRIRIYNCSLDRISLELKQKESSKTHKISCPLSKEVLFTIMEGKIPAIKDESPYLLKKLIARMHFSMMRPVCIVAYERTPFIYKTGNVRITFDRNIRSSSNVEDFYNPDCAFRPVLDSGTNMMEVKYDELLPDHIANVMETSLLKQSSFSKYYLCRKYNTRSTIL